ncbi:MAG: two-component regulator propeller domain-containing protein [Bacteroidota bacterium]
MRSVLTPLLLILLCTCARAQELPPIVAYETETYAAGSQSWMLSQDENGYLYAANNEGLLEFNGQQWTLHPAPGETIIRSVRAHGDRIYTGTYMDFGYWSRTATGSLAYRSLTGPMRDRILNDEQFWNIIAHEEYVVFQSLQQLFLYDPENGDVRRITPPGGIGKLFSNRRGLFFTSAENGLYRLTGGEMAAVFGTDGPDSPVAHLWVEDGRLLLQTISSGCYALDDGRLIRQNRHAFLDGKRIYSAVSRRGGGLVFGTISHGLYIVDPKGKLRYQLDQTDGLTNNTILSLFEDDRNNLWAGTDNGISYVNLSSPFRKFTDNSGRLGTVHNSVVLDGRLYLGSNQGLFVKRFRSDEPLQLIDGTRGQVWSLFVYDGTLFAGHDRGTFVVTGERAQRLDGTSGTWTFSPLPDRPDLLLQGHYSGGSTLQNTQTGIMALQEQIGAVG